MASALTALQLSEHEQAVLDHVEVGAERCMDEIIRGSGLPSSVVSVALLGLEMKRLVRQLPGRLFVRNR